MRIESSMDEKEKEIRNASKYIACFCTFFNKYSLIFNDKIIVEEVYFSRNSYL